MARSIVVGGRAAKRYFAGAKAQLRKGVDVVAVGWPSTARYPPVRTGLRGGGKQSPELVGNIAAIHEFGLGVPPRPFMRQTADRAEPQLKGMLRRALDAKRLTIDDQLAARLGVWLQWEVQKSITVLKTPGNAESTVKRKGSSNPLIDTGFMRASVTWEAEK